MITLRKHVSDETLTISRMLPSRIMSVRKHWLLVEYILRNRSGDETLTISPIKSDITLGHRVRDETLTTVRMFPSGTMSVNKLGRWFSLSILYMLKKDKRLAKQTCEVFSYKMSPPESCQRRHTDYWSHVTLGNRARDETLTTGRMLASGIKSVKKHWLLVGGYQLEPYQWRSTD